MSSEDTLFNAMMQTSVTSESSTLSGLATGPVPGSALGVGSAPGGLAFDSDASYAVMNDKVQTLAGSIYEELETMITKYGQDVVKNLMPLIVNVLESLDLAYTDSQELEVELELLKEDNEQLVTQYEREKQLRKGSDQKLLEIEDSFDGERKEATVKIDSLTSIVKMFELKSKNSQDHIARLEDKENEMKKEYSKLHERYTELFKTHIDYMERTKSILGTERLDQIGPGAARPRIAGMALNQLNRSSGPVSFGYSELENNNHAASILTSADFAVQTTPGIERVNTSLKTELMGPSVDNQRPGAPHKGQTPPSSTQASPSKLSSAQEPDKTGSKPGISGLVEAQSKPAPSSLISPPVSQPSSGFTSAWMDGSHGDTRMVDLEVEEAEDVTGDPSIGPDSPTLLRAMSKSQTTTEKRTGNTLYQELSFQDSEALGDVDEGADITDSDSEMEPFQNCVNDNYFGKTTLRRRPTQEEFGRFSVGIYAIQSMGKEVENLISENNELLATKNALNIVKDDLIAKVDELSGEHEILREEIKSLQEVRSRLQQRVQELEDELKKVKEEAEAAKTTKSEEDEEVPMAQRKRFTRVEMARVLMERNQYKERFMELQEAVRWTEMLRASRSTEPAASDKKNNRGIWKFFGSLFSGAERMGDPMGPYLKYSGSSPEAAESVTPALSTMRARSSAERKSRTNPDVFDGDNLAGNNRRTNERKEQYKQVRAHVKQDDGRMQAYGWSVPASSSKSDEEQPQQQSKQQLPVPVPVYCRPLMEKEPGMKIWCAAAVNMSGGRTKDGGDIVGASVFYHDPPPDDEICGNKSSGVKKSDDPVAKLDDELSEGQRLVAEATSREKELSSHVWICTSTHSISKVTVIDANSPADVLESFHVCSSHLLCIASVPGAKESDYRVDEELNRLVLEESELRNSDAAKRASDNDGKVDEEPGLGDVSFVTCATGAEHVTDDHDAADEQETEPRLTKETSVPLGLRKTCVSRTADVYDLDPDADDEVGGEMDPHATLPFISHHTLNLSREIDEPPKTNRPSVAEATDAVHRRFMVRTDNLASAKVVDGVSEVSRQNEIAFSEVEKMSSVLPTMWLGSQSGAIYVHSAVAQWKRCIHSIRLKDSVLCIVHVKGRVMAALANGTIAIFHRSGDGQWDLTNYHLLELGKPHSSIRCMVQVHNKVWCGYRNKIFVINPKMMRVEATFDAHPRKESQVRQMAWTGDGVWVSIRLDSTLRMYHAHTHEHLQDVDIEPYVSKMLGTGKLGFSFVRITSLIVSVNRLWMGTGNGVIISVPLAGPSNSGKIYSDERSESLTAETFVPFCNMSQAQLSFHGHRDAVKFFVAVPGHGGLSLSSTSPGAVSPDSNDSMLIVSGGEGYIDFRIVDDGSDQDHDSHLMVWQIRRSPTSSPKEEQKSLKEIVAVTTASKTYTQESQIAAKSSPKSQETQKSPSFGQRVLQSISPSLAQRTLRSSALMTTASSTSLRQNSPSPFTTSRSSSQASSVDALNASEHVSFAREAAEVDYPVNAGSNLDQTGGSLDQTGSYLGWNRSVESMMNCPEPREDFTQLPVCTTPSFDRGLN